MKVKIKILRKMLSDAIFSNGEILLCSLANFDAPFKFLIDELFDWTLIACFALLPILPVYTAALGALFLGSSALALEQNCNASSREKSCLKANLM